MKNRLLGATLLVAGNAIGGGMLALPISTAEAGLGGSLILFVVCWLLMTYCALMLAEVNLRLPLNSNLISMSKAALGYKGPLLVWPTSLLFLYSLVAAYISAGNQVINNIAVHAGFQPASSFGALVFLFIFGAIVIHGIRSIDLANRLFMFLKLITFLGLFLLVALYIDKNNLSFNQPQFLMKAAPIAITAFGFASIIPSLRVYLKSDARQLRLAIIIGSLFPLIFYSIWEIAVLGAVPLHGPNGLSGLMAANEPIVHLVNSLNYYAHSAWLEFFSRAFTIICVVTTFLCISISLFDFIADGFALEKSGRQKIYIAMLSFLPPLFAVLFYPHAYILGLTYAGICCILLQSFLPALMAWRVLRCQVFGGKLTLVLVMMLSLLMMIIWFFLG